MGNGDVLVGAGALLLADDPAGAAVNLDVAVGLGIPYLDDVPGHEILTPFVGAGQGIVACESLASVSSCRQSRSPIATGSA